MSFILFSTTNGLPVAFKQCDSKTVDVVHSYLQNILAKSNSSLASSHIQVSCLWNLVCSLQGLRERLLDHHCSGKRCRGHGGLTFFTWSAFFKFYPPPLLAPPPGFFLLLLPDPPDSCSWLFLLAVLPATPPFSLSFAPWLLLLLAFPPLPAVLLILLQHNDW